MLNSNLFRYIKQYLQWTDPCISCLKYPVCSEFCGEKNHHTYGKPALRRDIKREFRNEIMIPIFVMTAAATWVFSIMISLRSFYVSN